VNVRDATPADAQAMLGFVEASFDELWKRPFPRPNLGPEELEGKIALLAEEDGEPIGCAYGELYDNGVAHLNLVYVLPERRREGVAKLLLAEFTARVRSEAEHMTLDVDTTNEIGRTAWQRLGFTEWALRMSAPIDSLESRLAGSVQGGESYASIHVQTDDTEEVERAVAKYLPRFGNSARTTVSPPRNGWVTVYDELCDRDRKVRERLSSELSNATAAVVCTLAVEDGRLVRYVLYERGSVVDEYQSVPEYYGPVVPGDAVALGSNPTVVARLTGAEPARVRAVARTAGSPDELPPAPELLAAIAEAFGLQGAGRGT
jgi:ribosomal protein S18 acetylase RimI-like enzyme